MGNTPLNTSAEVPSEGISRSRNTLIGAKVIALSMYIAGLLGGGHQAQAQNLVAATTTAPVAGETGTTPDPYVRHRKALEWLVKESAASTPDTSDDALSTQGGLYKLLVDDFSDDGVLNSTNQGIVGSLANAITMGNPGDELRTKFANTAGRLLMGKDLVSGSVANATPVVPVEAEVNIEGKKPALGSKEEEEEEKARIEKEKQKKVKIKIANTFNETILEEESWIKAKGGDLDADVHVSGTSKSIEFELKKGNKGRFEADIPLFEGNYTLDLQIEGGKLTIWTPNGDGTIKREEVETGKHSLYSQGTRLGIWLNSINKKVKITKFEISVQAETENEKIVTNATGKN